MIKKILPLFLAFATIISCRTYNPEKPTTIEESTALKTSNASGLICYESTVCVPNVTTDTLFKFNTRLSKAQIDAIVKIINDTKLQKLTITRKNTSGLEVNHLYTVTRKQAKEMIKKKSYEFLEDINAYDIKKYENKISSKYNFFINDKYSTKFSCQITIYYNDGEYSYKITHFKTHINNEATKLERYINDGLNKDDMEKIIEKINNLIDQMYVTLK